MPIRFRCPNCNQRLGIGSRKAGTLVHCPTCHGPVTVPEAENAAAGAAAPRPPQALFERSEFEEIFQPSVPPAPAPVATAEQGAEPFAALGFPAIPQAQQPSTGYDVEPLGPVVALPQALPASTSAGLLLSPRQTTMLTITVILLLAVAFGAGLAVGRFLL